jgi:hypothetical protein
MLFGKMCAVTDTRRLPGSGWCGRCPSPAAWSQSGHAPCRRPSAALSTRPGCRTTSGRRKQVR